MFMLYFLEPLRRHKYFILLIVVDIEIYTCNKARMIGLRSYPVLLTQVLHVFRDLRVMNSIVISFLLFIYSYLIIEHYGRRMG